MEGVGRAAAGAVESRPAVIALWPGVGVAGAEFLPQGRIGHAVPDVAQLVGFLTHELMAGIQVSPRGHSHILRAGAAAGDPLVNAGAARQIQHVVIEGDGLAFLFPTQHILGQQLVLVLHDLQILRRQRGGVLRRAHHRLHAQLREAQIRHVEQVLRKVRIGMGKGAAHIIVLVASGLYQLLELRHNALVAAIACIVHPQPVMNFLAAIQRQHHIAHFPVGEVDHVIVDEHTVCGQRKAEIFAPLLFHTAGILHQLLHHVPVHQRLTAEEVHLQIGAAAGVIHQKVQSLLANLKAHQRTVSMVFSLAGEAVGAVQVAGVRHMQAQRLHHIAGTLLERTGHVCEGVGGIELPGLLQRLHVINAVPQILLRHILALAVFFHHRRYDLIRRVIRVKRNDVIGYLIHYMNGAGAGVQHDVVAVQLILMYHSSVLLVQKKCRLNRRQLFENCD